MANGMTAAEQHAFNLLDIKDKLFGEPGYDLPNIEAKHLHQIQNELLVYQTRYENAEDDEDKKKKIDKEIQNKYSSKFKRSYLEIILAKINERFHSLVPQTRARLPTRQYSLSMFPRRTILSQRHSVRSPSRSPSTRRARSPSTRRARSPSRGRSTRRASPVGSRAVSRSYTPPRASTSPPRRRPSTQRSAEPFMGDPRR